MNNLKRRLLLAFGVGLCVTIFGIMAPDRAGATENQEQVVVSPAQQAVNDALTTANTEVQQAIAATDTATATIAVAVVEKAQAQAAVDTVTATVAVAQTLVVLVDTATATINSIDLSVTPVDQSSQVVQDAKNTITTAQTSINNIDTSTAQVQIAELVSAKTQADSATATAQTELTQANIAIDNAQTAVNNLQATIGTSTNVLAGVDDAGILMNLPFDLLMGGVLYENVYVGSNATITFGVNEGSNYYSTPNAPSVSIAGWDWTTWSTGTGITYATTESTLDIAWDLRPYPQQDASTQMAQIRFNADVNPANGAWQATVTAIGPIPEQARFNYRETTNGTVTDIVDTNVGSGFAGELSQGPAFTPLVNNNTAGVQAAVDAANATIAQLNQSLTPVVAQNTTNTTNKNNIGSTTSLTNALASAQSTKTSLQSSLNTKAEQLNFALSSIPNPPAPPVANLNINYDLPDNNEQNQPNETTPIEEVNTEPEAIPETPAEEMPVEEPESPEMDTPEVDEPSSNNELESILEENQDSFEEISQDNDTLSVVDVQEMVSNLVANSNLDAVQIESVLEAIVEGGEVSSEIATEVSSTLSEDGLTEVETEFITEMLLADGEITTAEVINLSEALSKDGSFTLVEKDLVADVLVTSAEGAPVEAGAIEAAGLEYRDLPPLIPVEVREDINGNPVVITAEVASALLVLESPAALLDAVATCFDPDQAIEGLTEEQKCELGKALLSIGADMSIPEREKAEDIVVVTIIAGQMIVGTASRRRRV